MLHSLTSCGESSDVMFAFSMNASLMMFTVNCFVFLILSAVSFRPPSGSCAMDMETSGGDCVTWLNKLQWKDGEFDQRCTITSPAYGVRTPIRRGSSLPEWRQVLDSTFRD